ncbi:ScbR family autoregulator-binding transcription factor [Streptomyces sp. ODS05-4]|uniref:ScbR family autoregulator-binding transcription factor n=1 Tax=Streptomyces sp. ODS05-4 TaxID=2944939 RepID=UPI00210B5748|nr:ScbR family autoregulator-binding transcription factor [Streptomyces sp. ODS05-4]
MVKQERAARTRQMLIRAAAEVFAEDGFASASLTTISRRAGVSNGALHFHFANKAALAQAVEDDAARILHRITEQAAVDHSCPLDELVDVTHRLVRRMAEDTIVRAGFGLCRDTACPSAAELRGHWQRWVEGRLGQAELDGELAGDVSAEAAAATVVAATVGFEVLGGRDPRWLSEQRLSRFWDLLLPRLTGLREPAAAGPCSGGGGTPEAS